MTPDYRSGENPRRKATDLLKPVDRLQLKSSPTQPTSHDTALVALLRKTAREARASEPRPFYSIREIANRFHISTRAVSHAFEQLKGEGLLRSRWGSRTIIEPVRLDRHLRIRGVVALLVSFDFLSRSDGSGKFAMEVSHELWKLGFASRVWLYEPAEMERLACCDRMIDEKPDAIIWFMAASRDAILERHLADSGIRTIHIAEVPVQSNRSEDFGVDATAIARSLAV